MTGQTLHSKGRKKAVAREARQVKFLVAQMATDRYEPQRIVIQNLSAFGLSCRAIYPPEVGEVVTFTLGPFGQIEGSVRWVRGRNFGVRLKKEIDTISIALSRTGFRAQDYDLPSDAKFENLMVFEYFRDGRFDKL
jgi:hypothetical protein